MNRRDFLRLTATAGMVVAVPQIALANKVPTLYCDGINCDREGFNALVRGDVVRFMKPEMARNIFWDNKTLHMSNCTFHFFDDACIFGSDFHPEIKYNTFYLNQPPHERK